MNEKITNNNKQNRQNKNKMTEQVRKNGGKNKLKRANNIIQINCLYF